MALSTRRPAPRRRPAEAYAEGIRRGDRLLLSQAITLVESGRPDDQALAQQVLADVLPLTGGALRVGITGVPGVGKSSLLEALGSLLTRRGHRLAVLTVDPTSPVSGGSILGDKTRMERLANDPRAFVRPSASGGTAGGVARRTREAILLCEAAGYDLIFVETVGVGQSEWAVRQMVDAFVLLMLAGAGDELQGIKRGILEMADVVAVTKADGPNRDRAELARLELQSALHLFPPPPSGQLPVVLTCSAQTDEGTSEVWSHVGQFAARTRRNGWFEENRRRQNRFWLHETLKLELLDAFYRADPVSDALPALERAVEAGEIPVPEAARRLLSRYRP
ncbi:MAG: methylmalonyl Co-A mutase-associated GTPase MeaB, partial [Catalinimonas sp.]